VGEGILYQPPLSLTYHPDCQRKLVTGTLPPRAAADGPDCRRAMTERESRDQRRLVLLHGRREDGSEFRARMKLGPVVIPLASIPSSLFIEHETKPLNIWIYFAEHSTALWAALSARLSGVSAWPPGLRQINASVERTRIKMSVEASAAEVAERAAFRATLMAELSAMRLLIKECDGDKKLLRERLHSAEAQILLLTASNEIIERWMASFKSTNGARTASP
jgi:hypothetical protein